MQTFIIIFGAVIIYLVIKWLSQKATITVPTAYAGSPRRDIPVLETLPLNYYPVRTYIDEKRIRVYNLIKIIIRGKSLEKFGIKDKSLVYVDKWNLKDSSDYSKLRTLIGNIVILNIDNERTALEHPFEKDFFNSSGYKARNVILIVDRGVSKSDLLGKLKFLNTPHDDYPKDIEEFKNRIYEKYKFASDFYPDDSNLIMSMTYRNDGTKLGFSFHSPKFIYGVVKHIVPPENLN